jgi:hypothetical protein
MCPAFSTNGIVIFREPLASAPVTTNPPKTDRSAAFDLAFLELRRTARSLNDIKAWCYKNILLLTAHSAVQAPSGLTQNSLYLHMGGGLLYGSLTLPGCRPIAMSYSEGHAGQHLGLQFEVHFTVDDSIDFEQIFPPSCGLFLRDAKKGSMYQSQAIVYAFAEDWPFIGAATLYLFDPADGFHEDHRHVLEASFPGLSWDVFLSFKEHGWVPEGRAEFVAWLFQFTEVSTLPDLRLALPGLE